MKIKFVFGLTVLLIFAACGNDKKDGNDAPKPSKEELRGSIKQMEDSLKGLQANLSEIKQIPNLTRIELINRLLAFYYNYPEDTYAAECLDKVHMTYSGMNVHEKAIAYADTLLNKYPKYVNRAMILESQGSSYDIFMQPRDSAKVRYFYQMLLNENPSMDKDKRTGIKDRLKNNHLNFDQYIEKKMEEIAKK